MGPILTPDFLMDKSIENMKSFVRQDREPSVPSMEHLETRGTDFMGLIPESGEIRSELHGFVVSLDGQVIVPRLTSDAWVRTSSTIEGSAS
jgi:hypothetical protein